MIRLWLCDDHAMLRGAVVQLLALDFPDAVFEQFADGNTLLKAMERPPDLLVLDLDLGGVLTGQFLIRSLLERSPELRILILTMHGKRDVQELCRRNGTRGFLSKAGRPELLAQAIRRILDGGTAFLDPENDRWISSPLQVRNSPELSDRESVVVQGLRSGKTLRTIADELGISPSAVGTYKRRLAAKLGASSNAALFRLLDQGVDNAL